MGREGRTVEASTNYIRTAHGTTCSSQEAIIGRYSFPPRPNNDRRARKCLDARAALTWCVRTHAQTHALTFISPVSIFGLFIKTKLCEQRRRGARVCESFWYILMKNLCSLSRRARREREPDACVWAVCVCVYTTRIVPCNTLVDGVV